MLVPSPLSVSQDSYCKWQRLQGCGRGLQSLPLSLLPFLSSTLLSLRADFILWTTFLPHPYILDFRIRDLFSPGVHTSYSKRTAIAQCQDQSLHTAQACGFLIGQLDYGLTPLTGSLPCLQKGKEQSWIESESTSAEKVPASIPGVHFTDRRSSALSPDPRQWGCKWWNRDETCHDMTGARARELETPASHFDTRRSSPGPPGLWYPCSVGMEAVEKTQSQSRLLPLSIPHTG